MTEVQLKWRRINFRTNVLMIAVFALVLQPLWSASVFALGPERKTEIMSPPTTGAPHKETKTTKDFLFTWQSVLNTAPERYALRASQNKVELSNPSSEVVRYSSLLTEPQLLANQIPGFYDGIWYWQVLAENAAGDKSPWSEIWEVELDTTSPAIEILKPSGAELIGRREVVFEAIIAEPELQAYSIKLDGSDITSRVTARTEEKGLRLSHTWPVGMLSDGAHVLEVLACDTTGHISKIGGNFTVDTAAPKATTSIVENETVKGDVSLDLSVKDPHLGPLSIEVKTIMGETVAGLQASLVSNEGVKVTRMWNTTAVNDGVYRVVFAANDAAGNQVIFTRTIIVSNLELSATGAGRDPLLEELSASLSQPLTIPQLYAPERPTTVSVLPEGGDIGAQSYDHLLEDIPEFTAVAATENGWQLFGVLWYWWLLSGAALGSMGMYFRRLLRRTLQQQLPDGV